MGFRIVEWFECPFAEEDQYEHTQSDAVEHEENQTVPLQILHEVLNAQVTHAEGDDRGDERRG